MMRKPFNNHVGGPPIVNISDEFGGVTALGLESLALVDNNSSSRGPFEDNSWD